MLIDGFGIAGYRSFGDEMVYINDLSKINVFIGKNNSGKSNILRFCYLHLAKINAQKEYKSFENLDFCKQLESQNIQFSFQIKRDSDTTGDKYKLIESLLPDFQQKFPEYKDSFWFKYSTKCLGMLRGKLTPEDYLQKMMPTSLPELYEKIIERYTNNEIHAVGKEIISSDGSTDISRVVDTIDYFMWNTSFQYSTRMVSAFRRVETPLIKELRRIQHPDMDKYDTDKRKFENIRDFVRELLGDNEADIELPPEGNNILIKIRNKVLPLNSLGAGIEELVILAAAVTIKEKRLFCIEEPEIHLHPELQKKFVKYILEKTDNQYLIASHSNAFFDIQDINIYHCHIQDDFTKCELVSTENDGHRVLCDLGYKPSDILLSNYVIWVEGPSDRIYLNKWINTIDSDLKEGIDYSIIFYGGRLLSHLTYSNESVPEDDITEFISLCKLNRNASIIIDSDRKNKDDRLNDTKKRIKTEFENNGAFVWITKGREIENYISSEALNSAVEIAHPKKHKKILWTQYGDLTLMDNNKSFDKVKVARIITKNEMDISLLDLNEKISCLVARIKESNQ